MKKITLVFACVVALSACNRESAYNQLPSDTPTQAAAPDKTSSESAASAEKLSTEQHNPDVKLSVDPPAVSACDDSKRFIASVKWAVNVPGVTAVRIAVNSVQEPEKKNFATGGTVGEAKTGEWVNAGVRFYVIDNATGRELDSIEVKSEPCTGKAG